MTTKEVIIAVIIILPIYVAIEIISNLDIIDRVSIYAGIVTGFILEHYFLAPRLKKLINNKTKSLTTLRLSRRLERQCSLTVTDKKIS